MRRTKADAEHTREALLDAAERLFVERGVSRTSLQEIARAAGVTRGAVYWHFKDKAELFNAMMARTTQPMQDAVKAIDTAHTADPLGDLLRSMQEALERIVHDPRTHRVFDIATHKVEFVDELLGVRARRLEVHRDCRSHIEATFMRAQALGHLPAATAASAMAVGYLGLVNGLIATWLLDTGLYELVPAAQASVGAYLRGLGATRL